MNQRSSRLLRVCRASLWLFTPLLLPLALSGQESGQLGTPPSVEAPLKIVKLLWQANPKSAGRTLSRSLLTAVERDTLSELGAALELLDAQTAEVVARNERDDPRYAASWAARLLRSDPAVSTEQLAAALEQLENLEDREMLWRVWLARQPATARQYLATALQRAAADAGQSSWRSRMIVIAVAADRPAAGETVLANWQYLDEAQRIAAIEPLTANAPSMRLLLEAVADGRVSRLLLNTNQLRKWQSSGDKEIENRIEALWGRVRRRDDAARRQLVEQTLAQLRDGATGSVARGIAVFDRVCAQCHRLHDRGYELGPDIAGNGRGNLEQLVSNVLDPSLVIGEAFQAKTVLTVDGEIVAGLVAAESEQYLKLKVQGGQTVEFDKQDVEQIKSSSKSLMPEGVETQMTEQELWDLLAYLCLLKPLGAADNELIPGAPAGFVQP